MDDVLYRPASDERQRMLRTVLTGTVIAPVNSVLSSWGVRGGES